MTLLRYARLIGLINIHLCRFTHRCHRVQPVSARLAVWDLGTFGMFAYPHIKWRRHLDTYNLGVCLRRQKCKLNDSFYILIVKLLNQRQWHEDNQNFLQGKKKTSYIIKFRHLTCQDKFHLCLFYLLSQRSSRKDLCKTELGHLPSMV